MARHNRTGNEGEALAAKYLEDKGYAILERNWRWEKAEIDIIAMHEGALIFVEVKTRSSARFGFPEESVTEQKQQMISNGAEAYILEHNLDLPIRFDIMAIIMSQSDHEVHHIVDAFFVSGD